MKKKILTCIIAGIMAVVMTLGLAGCTEDYLPEYESEYFRYAVRTNKDGTKEGYLIGFTELGAEQTHLILPQEINGIPIMNLGYERQLGWGGERVGEFYSKKLEKLYITTSAIGDFHNAYGGCDGGYLVKWKRSFHGKFPMNADIIGFNILSQFFDSPMYNNYNRLANISYMYNYEGAEDSGYYWVDSYDNSTVEFIPPEPTREGYRFGGWYKEPECENAWDFETDKTGDEIVIEAYSKFEDYEDSNITYLYAKWIKEGEDM